jgi:ferredoxin
MAAPDVFDIDDEDKAFLLLEEPPDALRAGVDEAVQFCPEKAIAVYDA